MPFIEIDREESEWRKEIRLKQESEARERRQREEERRKRELEQKKRELAQIREQEIALERQRLEKLTRHYAHSVLNFNEERNGTPSDFNFLKVVQEQKLLNEENLAGVIKKIAIAVEKSDHVELSIYLGPQIIRLRQCFHQQIYQRNKEWLSAKQALDFDAKVERLVKCYARKILHDAIWKEYEEGIKTKQQMLKHLEKEGSEAKGSEVKENDEKPKQIQLASMQQAIAVFEKVKPLYEASEKLFQQQGLDAYAKAMFSVPYNDVLQLFNDLLKAHQQGRIKNYEDLNFTNQQKVDLKGLIRQEFEAADFQIGGHTIKRAERVKKNQDVPKGFALKSMPMEAKEQKLPRLMQHQVRLHSSSPLRTTDTTLVQHTSKPQGMTHAKYIIGSPEWHSRYELVVVASQRPDEFMVDRALRRIERMIDTTENLAEVLFIISETYSTDLADCNKCKQTLQSEEKAYHEKVAASVDQYKKNALELLRKTGKQGESAEEVINEILKSHMGEYPLDMDCFYENGLSFLHIAMKQYKSNRTPQGLSVIVMLMESGLSPYVLRKEDKNRLPQTAFQYAWDKPGEVPDDWDVIGLTFKNMPTFSPLTEKICKFVADFYCPQSKKQEASTLYKAFHSLDIKKDRRAELILLGQLIWESAHDFKEGRLIAWIQQKNGIEVSTDKIKELNLNIEEKMAKRGGKNGSELYKKLLEFVNEAEAGKLGYFEATEHEMLKRVPESKDKLSMSLVPA